jgi:hypothetical protein
MNVRAKNGKINPQSISTCLPIAPVFDVGSIYFYAFFTVDEKSPLSVCWLFF